MARSFQFTNKTKAKLPRLAFRSYKDAILGKKYELSVAFVGDAASKALNKKHRNKNKIANILSFPLSKTSGEIIIAPRFAKKEAPKFDRNYKKYLAFLFIHGLIHLKGYDHGSRMEHEEQKFRNKFGI